VCHHPECASLDTQTDVDHSFFFNSRFSCACFDWGCSSSLAASSSFGIENLFGWNGCESGKTCLSARWTDLRLHSLARHTSGLGCNTPGHEREASYLKYCLDGSAVAIPSLIETDDRRLTRGKPVKANKADELGEAPGLEHQSAPPRTAASTRTRPGDEENQTTGNYF
jgi:hypothetical protein